MTEVEAKLLPEPPLLVLPSLAVEVGLNEAVVLQQLHFRSRSAAGGDGWWQASLPELRREFPFWSEATIKRALASLKRGGLVKVSQAGTDRTNRYSVDYEALHKRVRPKGGHSDPVQGVTSASNRSDRLAQAAPVSFIGSKKNGKREEGPHRRFSRFDQAEQR